MMIQLESMLGSEHFFPNSSGICITEPAEITPCVQADPVPTRPATPQAVCSMSHR